ncbi:MAG: hypothetical protein L0H24_06790, partial [Microlunatus sp.]|nr:hypothetical protein [Microlunatus sp.]
HPSPHPPHGDQIATEQAAATGEGEIPLAPWEKVLQGGVDEIARALVSPDEWSTELRANTPFPGVLSESARQALLRSFRRLHTR